MQTGSIYALIDPRDEAVRYVGQTVQDLEKRLSDHLSGPTNDKTWAWFRELKALGLRPRISLLETAPIKRLKERECHWLKQMFLRGERPYQLADADTLWELHKRKKGFPFSIYPSSPEPE